MRRSPDELQAWLEARDGIAHRADVLRAGFSVPLLRAFARSGRAVWIRRAWVALPSADPLLATAARAGGRVSCTSLARSKGWWMPEGIDTGVHLHVLPGAASTGADPAHVRHWTKPLVTPQPRALVTSIEDALGHIALCRPLDEALVLWESASRQERLAPEYLRAVNWTSSAARELARATTGLADSGLETLVVAPLRRWGLRVTPQVVIAGRPVDLLVGSRLVLQIDGYTFHEDSAQRSSDIAHDAELRLRGYTVLRFSYRQVVHEWPLVERTIRRALATGLHRAA